ncbi:hypothetical protein AOLI_G00136030 [Acnodon oligacanthus]
MENNNGYEQEEDMLQEDEWDRDLLLDPAWEKQQRKRNWKRKPGYHKTTWNLEETLMGTDLEAPNRYIIRRQVSESQQLGSQDNILMLEGVSKSHFHL